MRLCTRLWEVGQAPWRSVAQVLVEWPGPAPPHTVRPAWELYTLPWVSGGSAQVVPLPKMISAEVEAPCPPVTIITATQHIF